MIIVNGVPKSGTTLLQQYLVYCGLELEPGGLMCYGGSTKLVMRGGKPWGQVRSLGQVLEDLSTSKVVSGHAASCIDFPGHKVLYIFRNPRDILISHARWQAAGLDWTNVKGQPSHSQVSAKINESVVMTVLANARDFVGWLNKADLAIAFEQLLTTPEATGSLICSEVGIPFKSPADIFGDKTLWVTDSYRGTWSGKLSAWRDFWDSGLDRLWQKHGGPELEREYGYSCLESQS